MNLRVRCARARSQPLAKILSTTSRNRKLILIKMPSTCALLKLCVRPLITRWRYFSQICCALRAWWRARHGSVCAFALTARLQTLSLRSSFIQESREYHVERKNKVCHFRRLALRRNPPCLHRSRLSSRAVWLSGEFIY